MNNPRVFFICVAILFFSCSSLKGTKQISYKVDEQNTVKFHIPKGYTLSAWSGGYEEEKQFWYSDSSVFYITKQKGMPILNAQNIKSIDGAYSKRMQSDTISFDGMDANKLHWRDMKNGKISYGYLRLTTLDKAKFDSIITNVKHK